MPVIRYVLKSHSTGARYVGITSDLERRLHEHMRRATKAGQLLGDFTLLHTEEFLDHQAARPREKFLKSGRGRKWLDALEGGPESR